MQDRLNEKNVSLEVVWLDIDTLTPYKDNAKEHTEEQIQHLVNSIKQFKMIDPVGVWGKDNTIVEGHGRVLACRELDMTTVPCIRLDHLTDNQRRAYTHIHNKLTLDTALNRAILAAEIADIPDIDMSAFGFYCGESVNYEHINSLLENDFVDVDHKPDLYSVTLAFPREHKAQIESYIKHHGKRELVGLVLDYIGGTVNA